MNEEQNLLTDAELAAKMAERPAPRVTKESIEARIVSVDYTVLPGTTVTICSLTLDNGYSVRGESACVNLANFDREIGQRYAYDDAFRKLCPLFGFLLAENQFRQRKPTDFRERVREEKRELDERAEKLSAFLDTDTYRSLPDDEQERMGEQLALQYELSRVLGDRIANFKAT